MPPSYAEDVLLMIADFGEDAVYTPFEGLSTNGGYFAKTYFPQQFFAKRYFPSGGSGTSPRTIKILTNRGLVGLPGSGGNQMGFADSLQFAVSTVPPEGIHPDDLDTGGDRINIALRVGEPGRDRHIVRVVEHDPQGYMLLEAN